MGLSQLWINLRNLVYEPAGRSLSHRIHVLGCIKPVRSKAVVMLLLTCCLLLLPLRESVIVLCFVVRYFMSF